MAGKYSKEIRPEEVKERLAKGERLLILDVREPEEWAIGHIPGAKHLPLVSIMSRRGELDRSASYIVVCRSGNRSGLACELLEELGFHAINMSGGMSGWTGEIAYGI
ncbi:sulfurtransferase [Cohnella sp. CIP 111063]|uniref:rhodanese-like domain-containing protein n=1 Tax=unclassified Cohnella TaxID=2636738 RepID=UPI000B8BB8C9|nr:MULTISPECIES: rhodanese-like domain-containing protein [unclassified Cohnella]OXS59318.1 sulfurtransferase [Cohnella sp. CIP 111063]PRX72343.1 rhodanese-related sulfurtransferase [Cohnella sp. SGD-V74]